MRVLFEILRKNPNFKIFAFKKDEVFEFVKNSLREDKYYIEENYLVESLGEKGTEQELKDYVFNENYKGWPVGYETFEHTEGFLQPKVDILKDGRLKDFRNIKSIGPKELWDAIRDNYFGCINIVLVGDRMSCTDTKYYALKQAFYKARIYYDVLKARINPVGMIDLNTEKLVDDKIFTQNDIKLLYRSKFKIIPELGKIDVDSEMDDFEIPYYKDDSSAFWEKYSDSVHKVISYKYFNQKH